MGNQDNLYGDFDNKEDYYSDLAKQISEEEQEETVPSKKNKKKKAAEESIPEIKHKPNDDEIEEYSVADEEIESEPERVYRSNEPIFPGGPLLSDIEEWKLQYPVSEQYKICHTQIDDLAFVFRTLNRFEYKQIINMNISATGREEAICDTCTLWPSNYTHKAMAYGRAGIPATYSNIIMQESGFVKEFSITEL